MAAQTGLMEELEELVTCPICLETFQDPRILRCHHSFCLKCLQGVLGREVVLCCPCCKGNTRVPKGVKNLPKDFRANSWLDKLSDYHKNAGTTKIRAEEGKPKRKIVRPLTVKEKLAKTCIVCDQTLEITTSKKLRCGHHVCVSCVEFLQPIGAAHLHCPMCPRETTNSGACLSDTDVPPQPSTNTGTRLSATVVPLQPTAPPSAYSRESIPHPQPTVNPGTSSRENVIRPQPTAPPGTIQPRPSITSPHNQPENTSAESQLKFHRMCGKKVFVNSRGITAYKSIRDTLVDAVLLTSRHLAPNELFEVRLDKAGFKVGWSIEIGVTTYSPAKSNFPRYLYDLHLGTWSMLQRKVWHNGETVVKQYQQDLRNLKEGDHVGVQRRENGDLHFYINGADLGVAESDVPADVYGVIDLRWGFEKVTIMNSSAPRASNPDIMPTCRQVPTPAWQPAAWVPVLVQQPAAQVPELERRAGCCILI